MVRIAGPMVGCRQFVASLASGPSSASRRRRLLPRRVEFRVQGLGFRVEGSGFRVEGSGFRVEGLGFRVEGLGFRV